MKKSYLFLLFLAIIGSGCIRQVGQMKRFGNCEFEYVSIDSVVLNGVPINKYSNLDNVSLLNASGLFNLLLKGQAPLKLKVYLQAKNNHRKKAAINQMEWQLYIEDKKILDGFTNETIEVAGHDSTVFAINMQMNLGEVMKVTNFTSLINIASSLLNVQENKGMPSIKMKLMVRPSFRVGKKVHQFPNYITITKDYRPE